MRRLYGVGQKSDGDDSVTIDDLSPWEPRAFRLGDRVILRPSPECPISSPFDLLAWRPGYRQGHAPWEFGAKATVRDVNHELARLGHAYYVEVDDLDIGNGVVVSRFVLMSAVEMEPLDEN